MKTKFFFFVFVLFVGLTSTEAQQANFYGTGVAPDFTLTDMNGDTHHLYGYLDEGKTVVLEFMNVFCGSCGMHSPPVENFWNNYGTDGTDEVVVIALEINSNSDSIDCINYISNYEITHPFINGASPFGMGYSVTYTPTFYVVHPDYSYTPVCYDCDYTTGSSTIEETLASIIENWTPSVSDLIISEYSEGSSYNKYVEIYNGTAYDVDLSQYELWKITNGGNWPETSLSLSGTLSSGQAFLVAHSSSNVAILSDADLTSGFCNFNGDDAIGLARLDDNGNFILIDAVGEDGSDPGLGWDVSGVSNATKDHTLIRFNNVCNPEIDWSVGSSQWEVLPQNTWNDIGDHIGCLNSLPIVHGCTNLQATNYDSTATQDDGTCLLPSIVIDSPLDGAVLSQNQVTVSFTVNNFRVGQPGPLVNGHIRYNLTSTQANTPSSDVMKYDTLDLQLPYNSNAFSSNTTWILIMELVDENDQSFSPVLSDTITFTVGVNVEGCTDAAAFNYDSNANTDDGSCFFVQPVNHTINTVGMFFDPDTLHVTVGDTIIFNIDNFHNAVEVDSATYVSNGAASNGGFSFGVGTFEWIVPQAQTYYYVCQPHAMMGMKGIIIASMPSIDGCTNPYACNYNQAATDDDGSCLITENPIIDVTQSSWYTSSGGVTVNIVFNNDGTLLYNGNFDGYWNLCGSTLYTYGNGAGYDIGNYDSNSGEFNVNYWNGNSSGSYTLHPHIEGCINPIACNYDPLATTPSSSLCTQTNNPIVDITQGLWNFEFQYNGT